MRRALQLTIFCHLTLASVAFGQENSATEIRTVGRIERLDPRLDALLPESAQIEVLADGFEWSEGPVWNREEQFLLFSDIPNNRIVKWQPDRGISVFLEPSGYTGSEPFTGGEPGTNGLLYDSDGRLLMCCHGDRAIKRLERDGTTTVLANQYEGQRLNSPNDLVLHSSGDLYFTDPPYGLPERFDDPARELDWCGVYRLRPTGELTLLTKEMTRPNGIALSPDERTLYIAQSDRAAPVWQAFEVLDDGSLGASHTLADAQQWIGKRPGGCDGMTVDQQGNLWATGPGGVWIISPQGDHLGTLLTGQRTANCVFGGDGTTLYITADMLLCRVATTARGLGFPAP